MNDFDGDVTANDRIATSVDGAHTALAEFTEDLIFADVFHAAR